jgi:hypothetical protein
MEKEAYPRRKRQMLVAVATGVGLMIQPREFVKPLQDSNRADMRYRNLDQAARSVAARRSASSRNKHLKGFSGIAGSLRRLNRLHAGCPHSGGCVLDACPARVLRLAPAACSPVAAETLAAHRPSVRD